MDLVKLKSWIEHWESRRNQTYDDKTGRPLTPGSPVQGHPTVGVGFNLDAAGAQASIVALGLDYGRVRSGAQLLNNAQIDALLDRSVNQAMRDARSVIPEFDSLPEDKQIVVVDMVFNFGINKFGGFRQAIQAIKSRDWTSAALQMEHSGWFVQVGNRAQADVDVMAGRRTATFQA